MKDTTFYNNESLKYSEKRYPSVAKSYTQFFFKERLRLVLKAAEQFFTFKTNQSLLEIGCADGIVLESFFKKYGTHFSRMIGIDISPGMIKAAQERYQSTPIIFKERSDYKPEPQNLILEVGVINYATFEEELAYISSQLTSDGIAIITLAGLGSLWDKRRKDDTGFNNFYSYSHYEKEIKAQFNLLKAFPVGLPIPLLWRLPSVALPLTSILEKLLRPIMPGFFHEKIYILAPKKQ